MPINKFTALLAIIILCGFPASFIAQNVGIGQAIPVSKLDVSGGITVGTGYSGINTAPANGAIIEGNTGIGTPTPTARLDVEGTFKLGVDGDVNNGLYTLDWNWGSQSVNTAGLRVRLTGTSSVLGIPSTAHVHISFLGVIAGGADGIGPQITMGQSWMETDAVGFWLRYGAAIGSYTINPLQARYTFIW